MFEPVHTPSCLQDEIPAAPSLRQDTPGQAPKSPAALCSFLVIFYSVSEDERGTER